VEQIKNVQHRVETNINNDKSKPKRASFIESQVKKCKIKTP